MNEEIKQKILEKIEQYDRIVIMRHQRPDGDAYGSCLGLRALLRASFPDKQIVAANEDVSDYVSFLGSDDEVPESFYEGALGIVTDTATEKRISNSRAGLCRELVKIDHHIDVEPYGDLSWVEEDRSSCCEMIADFYNSFRDRLVLTEEAAACLYTGMCTDSLRFKTKETGGETLRMAAVLLDRGIDTETIFAHLSLVEQSELAFHAWGLANVRFTEHGVAYLYLDAATQAELGLTTEQASNCVSFIDNVKGSLIWLAFIEYPDGTVRVRLRSRFTTVDGLANRYHGGGHACASGATCYSREEYEALLRDADEALREYKETHEGWL